MTLTTFFAPALTLAKKAKGCGKWVVMDDVCALRNCSVCCFMSEMCFIRSVWDPRIATRIDSLRQQRCITSYYFSLKLHEKCC